MPVSHLSAKVRTGWVAGKGRGAFALAPIAAGELIALWGGPIVDGDALQRMAEDERHFVLQVEADLFQVPMGPEEPADLINHSCAPNAGLSGQIGLVAMRVIAPGEEICFDYAMADTSPLLGFTCQCGALDCRGRVTGEDWRLPRLQRRYGGFFSPYLQRRIDAAARPRRPAVARTTIALTLPLIEPAMAGHAGNVMASGLDREAGVG